MGIPYEMLSAKLRDVLTVGLERVWWLSFKEKGAQAWKCLPSGVLCLLS